MDADMSSVTDGDPELARLLASATSCGWDPDDSVTEIAERCQWPCALTTQVTDLNQDERTALVQGARLVWEIFASPAASTARLNELVGGPRLAVLDQHGVPSLSLIGTGRPSEKLLRHAALGLLHVLTDAGSQALDLCAAAPCDQPVLRIGHKRRSNACSSRCANRQRVIRHRTKDASP